MKLFLIVLLLPVLGMCASCGQIAPAKKNQKDLQDVQEFIERDRLQDKTERRQDEVFMRMGQFKNREEFKKYVEMISSDGYDGNYELSEVK